MTNLLNKTINKILIILLRYPVKTCSNFYLLNCLLDKKSDWNFGERSPSPNHQKNIDCSH